MCLASIRCLFLESGLDQLEQLIIRGNKFRNLNRVDIFVGCKAKLQRLDLSDNMLMSLPGGAFLGMTSSLTALILAGNNFHTDLLDDDDFDRMPSPIPAGYDFANLQLLDLSRTQLKIFKGVWVKNIQNLTDLDISCNKFKRVTKEFFTALPSSLRKLNMSFCATNMLMSPDIVEDAFSTLGAVKNWKKNIEYKTKKRTRKIKKKNKCSSRIWRIEFVKIKKYKKLIHDIYVRILLCKIKQKRSLRCGLLIVYWALIDWFFYFLYFSLFSLFSLFLISLIFSIFWYFNISNVSNISNIFNFYIFQFF